MEHARAESIRCVTTMEQFCRRLKTDTVRNANMHNFYGKSLQGFFFLCFNCVFLTDTQRNKKTHCDSVWFSNCQIQPKSSFGKCVLIRNKNGRQQVQYIYIFCCSIVSILTGLKCMNSQKHACSLVAVCLFIHENSTCSPVGMVHMFFTILLPVSNYSLQVIRPMYF